MWFSFVMWIWLYLYYIDLTEIPSNLFHTIWQDIRPLMLHCLHWCSTEQTCQCLNVCLPHEVSMKLNVQSLSISLCTHFLHCGGGGAEHQLQVCLRSGGDLWARGRWLWINTASIETQTAPLGVLFKPVPLSWAEPGSSCHTAATTVTLHVSLLRQKYSF